MKNFIQKGDTLSVTAPYAVSAGGGVQVGSIFGVAINDAANGADVVLALEGVYELAKTTAEAWTQGQYIYWNNTTKALTTTVGANLKVGYARQAQLAGDTTGLLLLADGGF